MEEDFWELKNGRIHPCDSLRKIFLGCLNFVNSLLESGIGLVLSSSAQDLIGDPVRRERKSLPQQRHLLLPFSVRKEEKNQRQSVEEASTPPVTKFQPLPASLIKVQPRFEKTGPERIWDFRTVLPGLAHLPEQ